MVSLWKRKWWPFSNKTTEEVLGNFEIFLVEEPKIFLGEKKKKVNSNKLGRSKKFEFR